MTGRAQTGGPRRGLRGGQRERRLPPLPGPATLVSLAWRLRSAPPDVTVDETEALLARTPDGRVTVEIDGKRAPAGGCTDDDDRTLRRLLAQAQARVAMVLALDASPAGSRYPRLDLNIHCYDKGRTGLPLSIGVADKEFRSLHRAAGDPRQRKSSQWALDWLHERLVLAPTSDAHGDLPGRVIISAGPRETGDGQVAFRIHGRGVAADVYTVGDKAMVRRVLLRGHDAQQGPLQLLHRTITFADESQATLLRAEMKRQLARLASGEGFLAMWSSYNRKESWWTHRTVKDSGYLKYDRVERRNDGVLRFHVSEPTGPDEGRLSLLDRAQRQDGEDELEIEAAPTLPEAMIREPKPEDEGRSLLDGELPADAVTCYVVGTNPEQGTIDLRPLPSPPAAVPRPVAEPAKAGFLYRAFRGDRRRLLRRRDAFRTVLRGQARIPNLLALLESDPVAAPLPDTRIEPESEAAWACFKGGAPTRRQREALDVALNTPDVAVIQGPPGTGKTQVIAALQTRLAEAGRGYARLRGSMLLTSYQHAAVDELVERSEIFGIPATKVDRAGRGTTVQVDRWQAKVVARLDEYLAASADGRGVVALRRITALVAGYLLAPTGSAGTAAMVRDLLGWTDGLVSGRLADRLRDCLEATGRARPVALGSDDEELALRAARGIRTTAEAFGDDGPATAAKALRRLRSLADGGRAVPEGALDLLAVAAAWNGAEPPFLVELAAAREAFLALLTRPVGPLPDPAVDPELRQLLEEVIDEVAQRVATSPGDGSALALLDYREALRGDPEAVRWTLREYTASYAATCQQAATPMMAEVKGETRVDDVVFDTVIVDEAARANPLDLMIPLIRASRRIVLVGDHNQLPQMLEPDVEREFEPDMRALLWESLFQRLFVGLDRPGVPVQRVVTLDTQFRMRKVLGDFVARNFYEGKLASPRPDSDFVHGIARYGTAAAVWADVPPQAGPEFGERSKRRPAEARVVAGEVARLLDEAPDQKVGVIAFYAAQVAEIKRQLTALGLMAWTGRDHEPIDRLRYDSAGQRLDRLLVGTVDAFQGKEFDIVVLSTTRCGPRHESAPPDPSSPAYRRWVARRYGHLTLINRLCVAMSRQQRLLIAMGSASMFEPDRAPAVLAPLTDFLHLCRQGSPDGQYVRT